MKRIACPSAQYDSWLGELEARRHHAASDARAVAQRVIDDVRSDGDAAVSRLLQQFDSVALSPEEILLPVGHRLPACDAPGGEVKGDSGESGAQAGMPVPHGIPVSPELMEAIDLAVARITRFHELQRSGSYAFRDGDSELALRVRPLRRIGIYVPGGRAVYLSTLIMCAVPARIAGVTEIVVATTPSAAARPELQYVARLLGVREIYRCGGAAGVAAMALGTQSLRRVDRIVGPGNQYVTAAKELLYGEVGLDMTAGPTEIVLIADHSTDPVLAAADLLAQAEHGPDSAPICITSSAAFADALEGEVERQLEAAGSEVAAASVAANGAIVLVDSLQRAASVVNQLGPEHVSVQCREESVDLDAIDNCGAIFLGPYAPVAIGDYVAGSNHVLPTAGAARFFSPLGVDDFLKRSSVVRLSRETFEKISGAGELLATFEGLPLHARSIAVRREESCAPEITRDGATAGGAR